MYNTEEAKGRPVMLNTPLHGARITQKATLNAYHRRLTYEEIANLEFIRACRRSLGIAFKWEINYRRVATERPLFTDTHKEARHACAKTHVTWNEKTWNRVFCIDEASIKIGHCVQVNITKRVEGKNTESYCIRKFRGYSS